MKNIYPLPTSVLQNHLFSDFDFFYGGLSKQFRMVLKKNSNFELISIIFRSILYLITSLTFDINIEGNCEVLTFQNVYQNKLLTNKFLLTLYEILLRGKVQKKLRYFHYSTENNVSQFLPKINNMKTRESNQGLIQNDILEPAKTVMENIFYDYSFCWNSLEITFSLSL